MTSRIERNDIGISTTKRSRVVESDDNISAAAASAMPSGPVHTSPIEPHRISIGGLLTTEDLLYRWENEKPDSRAEAAKRIRVYLTNPESNQFLLDLSKCGVDSLPDIFADDRFADLATLDLQQNALINLPPSMDKLTSLTVLDITENQFETLPDVIHKMPCLFCLSAGYNNISKIDPKIETWLLENAEMILTLTGNPLLHLSPSIVMRNNTHLGWSHSSLHALCKIDTLLKNHDQISFVGAIKLSTDNPVIEDLRCFVSRLSGAPMEHRIAGDILQFLSHQDPEIRVRALELVRIKGILERVNLILSGSEDAERAMNELRALVPDLPHDAANIALFRNEVILRSILLTLNDPSVKRSQPNIYRIYSEFLHMFFPSHVSEHWADSSEIDDIEWACSSTDADEKRFEALERLKEQAGSSQLDLSHLNLTSLPDPLFHKWTQIETLRLGNNRLKELPASFGKTLKHLKVCDLRHNQLSELPEALGDIKEIKALYIHANPVQRWPYSTRNLLNITDLWISPELKTNMPADIDNHVVNAVELNTGEPLVVNDLDQVIDMDENPPTVLGRVEGDLVVVYDEVPEAAAHGAEEPEAAAHDAEEPV